MSSVPRGHVRLILLHSNNSRFYLQIPLKIIKSVCSKHRKYLVFLGWCILGADGHLSSQPGGPAIAPNGALHETSIYYYVVPGLTDIIANLSTAVNPGVLERQANVPSETSGSRNNFCNRLLSRDEYCVWTGFRPESGGVGMHIMPFRLGSKRFRLLIQNRPNYEEDVTELNDINDIRNGVFSNPLIHTSFDQRKLVVLKTPNRILGIGDIPHRHRRTLPRDTNYPHGSRYTLQWLTTPDSDPYLHTAVPNNSDAAFKTNTEEPKPSELLLHYNYGTAAIRMWGHGIEVLRDNAQHPRPPTPEEVEMGPSRTIHKRTIVRQKLEVARSDPRGGNKNATAGPSGTTRRAQKRDADGVDKGNTTAEPGVEDKAEWDEDDVMLFLWSNTPAARERRRKKAEESAENMERWRKGVEQASV